MAYSSSSSTMNMKRGRRCSRLISSDIIMWEILPRLPVKTLCKFRCVSKSWDDLLSDPDFLQLHWRRSKQNPRVLVIGQDYERKRGYEEENNNEVAGSAADLGFHMAEPADLGLDMGPFHKIASACHGLVLVYNHYMIRIWNPATGQWIDIDVRRCGEVILAAAIGYVETTKEYKVLIFHGETSCKVLTVGSGGWRATKNPPPFNLSLSEYDIAVVNRFIHVLPLSSSDGIARFDLGEEDWSVIPGIDGRCHLPSYKEYRYGLMLREVNGFLCMVRFRNWWSSAHIWFLKDYDEGIWVKEYTIDMSHLGCSIVEPLLIEEDGRILFTRSNILFYYDPESKTFQEIYKRNSFSMLSALYSESFASLKRDLGGAS